MFVGSTRARPSQPVINILTFAVLTHNAAISLDHRAFKGEVLCFTMAKLVGLLPA